MQAVVDYFERIAQFMPLEIFVLAGTFIEELVSPVPSFAVLVPAGAAVDARNLGVHYLAILMIISAFGRIGAGSVLYWIADKFEDKLLASGRRFFGISHRQIEQFGQRLGQAGKRDWAVLFLMNAVPFFPGGAVSLLCGFVKVRFVMYLFCTFFGTMINAIIYLSVGYAGFRVAEALKGIEIAGQITLFVMVVAALVWFARRRKKKDVVV